jgi:hypothetical protein
MIDLVAEDEEGHFGEIFHLEKSIQFDLCLLKAIGVLGVDEEEEAGHFGSVVSP